ncbi:MAG: hypothetical protein KDI36_03775 [Pseudomonadales bacterium]|nr:hypothetical protein [Pseudomonadales bacterium]
MKIAILKPDSVLEQFQPEHGDYEEMLSRTLYQAEPLVSAAQPLQLDVYDVMAGEYPVNRDEYAGFIITGSKQSVYEPDAWIGRLRDYVVTLHQERRRLVGICFGHQMVALALGGETRAAPVGWNVGMHESTVREHRPFMNPPMTRLNLLHSHKDQVLEMPAEATCLASAGRCPTSMMMIGEHIFTVQGHPEFVPAYSKALMEFRREMIGEENYMTGMASLAHQSDSPVVAQWILRFIANEA